ncbi:MULTISPECIES: hypothetical protein [Pantoea]|jgi:hypothetical protein|uniref:Uncharacterized protein n=2 Tax=Pantoea ananas TaxID=553 RepID=D4GJ09_PANAM|nr:MULTISPECIES: hypothetical protein [Pantoea]ADD75754.1 Hypothetical Protein PANA_0587 [Pantoea ananatis LMG 20103]KNA30024.1 hypothetical protein ACO03_14190 [Pantoea ananatis]MCH9270104.1 hypothetical protein [Pantoea ananatis]MDC7870122.1 hypothetical protein [Pantoea ananatis]MDI3415979.1 hypothetical protein [Pantoea sp. V106_11]
MALPGQSSNNLPDYNIARRLGMVSADDIDFTALANRLDCTRDFSQVGIIYSDGREQWLVRPSRRYASSNQSNVSHVVITKVPTVTSQTAAKSITDTLSKPSLANEITSTAFSCGAAVATAFLAIAAGSTVPLTAGATGVVAGIIAAGTFATVGQCINGGARLLLISAGHEESVNWIDSQGWYTATCTALDLISLAGAGAGLKGIFDTYKLMRGASSARAIEWLKTLSRAERKRITQEIIRIQNPGISNSGIKAIMHMGGYPKRFPTEALQKSLQKELANAIINTSAFAGSALTGTIRNPQTVSQSGKYIIGLLQSFNATGIN